jgi:hypothetical protein
MRMKIKNGIWNIEGKIGIRSGGFDESAWFLGSQHGPLRITDPTKLEF